MKYFNLKNLVLTNLKLLNRSNNQSCQIVIQSNRAYSANKLIVPQIDTSKPAIGRSRAEQEYLFMQQPDMPPNGKVLKICVLGMPNSGKSSLVNRLMNRRVCAVSSKMNTTNARTTAVLTQNDTQVIILDTPGLLSLHKSKKFNLDRSMIIDPHSSLWEADLVLVMHDVADEFSAEYIDREILKCLFAHPEKETILVLNKTDKVKNKKSLLDTVLQLTGGCLAGKKFIQKEERIRELKLRNSLKAYDFDRIFAKTAEKMHLQLEDGASKASKEVLNLLKELKQCEEYLAEHKSQINVQGGEDVEQLDDQQQSKTTTIDQSFPTTKKKNDVDELGPYGGMTLQKLMDTQPSTIAKSPNLVDNKNEQVSLVASIINATPTTPSDDNDGRPVPRRIEDISPEDFRNDLLKTTDWHMYYRKLSALAVFIRDKSHWPYFNQVFFISAKTNDGVDDLKNYIFSRAKPGPWLFSRSLVTDQMPNEIAEMCVREKMLEVLPGEMPYQIELTTLQLEVDDDNCLNVVIEMRPPYSNRKRHLSILFSNHAAFIKQIKLKSHQELMNIFECEVKFKLNVKFD